MRPFSFNIDPANVDPNGMCAAITGTGPWTLAGDAEFVAETSGDNLAHQLGVSSTADINTIVFTLTGTDADGQALTATVTGVNNNTVETTEYFLTLTGVSVSATLGANTVDIGWVDEVQTQTYRVNWRSENAAAYATTETGTADWTVQECFQDISGVTSPAQNARWFNLSNITTQTDSIASIGTVNATAMRVILNSYTDTASLYVDVSQGIN